MSKHQKIVELELKVQRQAAKIHALIQKNKKLKRILTNRNTEIRKHDVNKTHLKIHNSLSRVIKKTLVIVMSKNYKRRGYPGKVSKKIFIKTHIDTLAEEVMRDIVSDISMYKETTEPHPNDTEFETTEYIISITVQER